MDDVRAGSILRAMRLRRGLRQVDLAALAGVSAPTISRIEHGRFDTLALRTLRSVARALDVRVDVTPWSRRGELARFATADHAELVEVVIRDLRAAGWDSRAEVSFSEYGERGFVDVLAWHAVAAALLVIEVKTEILDVGEVIGSLDRKRRLGATLGRRLGWSARHVSCALIVLESRLNRRRIEQHAATFRSMLPHGGRAFRTYLQRPIEELAAVAFLTNVRPGNARQLGRGVRRVRRPRGALDVRG